VNWAGFASHFDPAAGVSAWPLPATRNHTQLAEFAERHGVLTDRPQDGDLFVMWSPVKRAFARTGIVISSEQVREWNTGSRAYECVTIEAAAEGEIVGDMAPDILVYTRRLVPARGDRFIHWSALEAAAVANEATSERRIA
jgi:hypothetical protein